MLHAPVLRLDAERMQEIDPRNVESLFGMWTVFSKCASTIPDGKRLENLSWRVWARETLCCPPQPERTIVPAIDIPLPPPSQDVPSLSNSLNSSDSDDDCLSGASSRTSQQDIMEASALSKSRGKEPHLTPDTLKKIVVTIQEKSDPKEPLSRSIEAIVEAKMSPTLGPKERRSPVSERPEQQSHLDSTESSCISTTNTADTRSTENASQHRNSDTSVSSAGLIRSGSVVHGFASPLSSVRSRTSMLKSSPVATKKKATATTLAPQKSAKFTLGGSSEDEGSSFGSRVASLSSYKKFSIEPRKSSLSHTLNKTSSSQQKTTSFRDIVEQRRIQEGSENDEGAIASSDEEDEEDDIDDSVIEDDDEAEWEDSVTDDEKPLTSRDFKRIDSSANLTSRRSILTAGLTETDRAQSMLKAACKSTSALRRSTQTSDEPPLLGSPEKDDDEGGIMMQPASGSKPMPIIATTTNHYAMAHSPRTTRRHMLSSELTESLRKNLLWERQQKNTTVNAFLKREARSMANLQRAGQMSAPQLPQPGRDSQGTEAPQNNSWNNEYFNVANEYHAKGW